MEFADEAQAQGQVREPAKPVVHRPHVVNDLLNIKEALCLSPVAAGLELEDIGQRCLCALDLGAQDGLAPDVHRHEEVGVREHHGRAVEASQGEIGLREEARQLGVNLKGRVGRKWGRDEGLVLRRLANVTAGALRIGIHR